MKAEDIQSSDDLEAWLKGLPEDQMLRVAPQIAHRAAMRVLPVWAAYCARSKQDSFKAISIFWGHLLCASCHLNRAALNSLEHGLVSAALDATSTTAEDIAVADPRSASAAAITATALAIFNTTGRGATLRAINNSAAAEVAEVAKAVAAMAFASETVSAYAAISGVLKRASSGAKIAMPFDALAVDQGSDLATLPLWPDGADPLAENWNKAAPLFSRHPAWSVFKDLYENTLHGRPQNWPLLTALAQKDEAFWTGTDTEVLDRIAEVMEDFERLRLLEETRAIKGMIEGAVSEFKRSHNNPPELIEDEEPQQQVRIISEGLDEVEHELAKAKPDKLRLAEIAGWLKRALLAFLSKCGDWANQGIGAFSQELGKLGARVFLVEVVTNGALSKLLSELARYASGG